MLIDTIYGISVCLNCLILGANFPEWPEDGVGIVEVVMNDVHEVGSFH